MKESYSYKDIVNSRSEEKKKIDKQDIWVYIFVRPFSFLVTWILMRMKFSANQATFLSTVISIIGSILLVTQNKSQTMLALIILNLWIVFDCVDGNIARTTHKSSRYGEFLDGLSGYIFTIFIYIFISINVFLNSGYIYSWIYIVLGAFTSMATIFPRLIEHKASNMFSGYKREATDRKNYSLFYIVGLNIAGMAGLSNPLMIIFFFFDHLNYYLIFYFLIHFGIAILSIYKTVNRIKELGE